jgi:hypothetical protein
MPRLCSQRANRRRENVILNKCEMNPERKKGILLCCAVACMSSGPTLLHNHRVLMLAWLGVMVLMLAYAVALLAKSKGQEQ